MRIKESSNGLLVAPIEITYRTVTHTVEDVVIVHELPFQNFFRRFVSRVDFARFHSSSK